MNYLFNCKQRQTRVQFQRLVSKSNKPFAPLLTAAFVCPSVNLGRIGNAINVLGETNNRVQMNIEMPFGNSNQILPSQFSAVKLFIIELGLLRVQLNCRNYLWIAQSKVVRKSLYIFMYVIFLKIKIRVKISYNFELPR